MSTKYKATMSDTGYFVTIATVGWIDIFTRLKQKFILTNALAYCQKYKGLEIYAYCIMPSHIHLLCKATEGYLLSRWRGFVTRAVEQALIEIHGLGKNGGTLLNQINSIAKTNPMARICNP